MWAPPIVRIDFLQGVLRMPVKSAKSLGFGASLKRFGIRVFYWTLMGSLTIACLVVILPASFPFILWCQYEDWLRPTPRVRCNPCQADCQVTRLGLGVWIAHCDACGCDYTSPRLSNHDAGRRVFEKMRMSFRTIFRLGRSKRDAHSYRDRRNTSPKTG